MFSGDRILGNAPLTWGYAALIAAATLLLLTLIRSVLRRWLRLRDGDHQRSWRAIAAQVVGATRVWLLLPLALYAGSLRLVLTPAATRALALAALMVFLLQVALWGHRFIACWIERQINVRYENNAERATVMSLLGFFALVVLWSVIVLFGLNMLGFNVSALLAGMGIGGIAIALAAQNILGDLFASASIVIDKPFVVGDFIIVGDYLGSVEHIGLKTTRLRSLSGEQLVFANTDLTKSRIRNYKRMYERRNVFTIQVAYGTPPDKLERIATMLRETVRAQDRVRLDRAHLKEYTDTAVIYEIVYYTLIPDYNFYMDTQQAINIAIYDWFQREGIEFGRPARVVQMQTSSLTGENGEESKEQPEWPKPARA
ncbi:MAG TPA: mechanosensitive ion channel family protein [Burkholderiales bacterium]|nr:mechanosensitive ion channel family protein [Burkholderiales bacterium]